MQTYEILVRNRAVEGNSEDMTLVRTSVGMDQVHVLFDSSEWLDFPVIITFAQGDDIVTLSLLLTPLDSAEWVAEATCTVPYEVIDMVGKIRVTLQGTDANGRHIITAKGSPLSVEESGDLATEIRPDDAPTIDQWQQAYAQAMAAASAAQGEVDNLRTQIETLFHEFEDRIAAMSAAIATTETLGNVIIGDNINVTHEGVISVDTSSISGLTARQMTALANLSALAYYCFDTEFDDDGKLLGNARVKPTVIPVASESSVGVVKVDGTTITVANDGTISTHAYTLPTASSDTMGGVMVGDGLTMTDGVLSVSTATSGALGVVRPDGTTITIDANGVITATGGGGGGSYVLPKAAVGQLGGIMVGNGLSIDESGVLSVDIAVADGMEF